MSISTLVKTIAISNDVAGEFKFEIFQDEHSLFYADISYKNSIGKWEYGHCNYRFSKALDVDEVVQGCIKFVENKAIDMNTGKILL